MRLLVLPARPSPVKKMMELFKRTLSQWYSREAPRMGASLAFYSILSLAPLVILVVAICALVFGTTDAQVQIWSSFGR
jgi:membrane protein